MEGLGAKVGELTTVPRSVAFLTGIGVHRVSAKTKLQDLWIYLDFDKLWLKTGTVL